MSNEVADHVRKGKTFVGGKYITWDEFVASMAQNNGT
jgi:hypothetical protein